MRTSRILREFQVAPRLHRLASSRLAREAAQTRGSADGMMLLRFLCVLLAATSVGALTAVPSMRVAQLNGAARAAVLASDKQEEQPRERVMPPERPREMMTESERRRAEPVHDIKQERKNPKIRDEEGNLIERP